ncbi:MAG: tRNA pseudouridine(13) synthase TruD [Thermodesulfovibrionales bacterium]|nr:tRNA pseudouridine(13) synthase TruD [Thermodesulfovibrionales bacterium]
MKIKVKPDDFVVQEKAKLPLRKGGRFKVYILTKKGYNTLDLLLKLSKAFGISFQRFSYGGKKDRYGLTSQYITIDDTSLREREEESFSLKYVGDMDRPMGPDLIEANEFKIVVRDLKEEEAEKALGEIEWVKQYGYPNYFDDQRFGSFSREQGFIAEKILKKHYNGAVKIYLTAVHPEDRKEEKERKRFFYENWGKWDECLKKAKTSIEKRAFRILSKKEEKPFLKIIQTIPGYELSIFFAAFQSYIWNKMAERIVMIYGDEIIRYRGNYWDYLFYRKPQSFEYLRSLIIPTASHKAQMPDELTEVIYNNILKEMELKPSMFNLKKIRAAFFSSTPRPFVVIPDLKGYDIRDDEVYQNRKALYLHFELKRGSYGTMFIKRLMADGYRNNP